MLVTDSDEVHERCRFLSDHGRPENDRLFQNREVAYKYKMSSLQAALGLAQLERIEELVTRKREIFGWSREALTGIDGVTLNPEPDTTVNTYWMVTAALDERLGVTKYELLEALWERGIDARPFFSPLSSLEAYAGSPAARDAERRNPVAYDIAARAVNLPSGFNLTPDVVTRVSEHLRSALDGLVAVPMQDPGAPSRPA
jgi:perosamine synthetase